MSKTGLDSTDVCRLLRQVADTLAAHTDELRDLDAKLGDGDLGVTAGAMAEALKSFSDSTDETDIGKLLMQCGMAVNRSNPSTFATIIATGFMSGGKALVGKTSLGLGDWATCGQSAIEGIQMRGKASPGDKTMLDALVPAVESLSAEVDKGSEAPAAARAAAVAAEEGMKATASMVAKCGRARAFQEKSMGVQDAGATAVFYMIEAFADFVGQSSSP